jgi:antitoxin component HigA of HigAB toxin-antitoxin module
MHQFMLTEEKTEQLNLHLEDCQRKFNSLRKVGYVPPLTQGEEVAVGEQMESASEEFEYDDAYSDPVEAIKLFVEILQTRTELAGGKRSKIITTEKAMEMMKRPVVSREFPLLPNGLITKENLVVSNYQRDLVVHTSVEEVVEKII